MGYFCGREYYSYEFVIFCFQLKIMGIQSQFLDLTEFLDRYRGAGEKTKKEECGR